MTNVWNTRKRYSAGWAARSWSWLELQDCHAPAAESTKSTRGRGLDRVGRGREGAPRAPLKGR